MKDDNVYSKYIDSSGNPFIKESRFSYIKPVHVHTRLIVYNNSNNTALDGIVYRGSKVIIEVPTRCMTVFTNNTFHAGVKSYERQGCNYLSHLRLFAYIVENKCVSIKDEATKLWENNECIPIYDTCQSLVNENIHYEGHKIRYLDTQCRIDNLPIGKVLLGDLEKVGWVGLECDYANTPNSKEQNYFYNSNNHKHSPKSHLWNKIH